VNTLEHEDSVVKILVTELDIYILAYPYVKREEGDIMKCTVFCGVNNGDCVGCLKKFIKYILIFVGLNI
jgi:hypothetical protein